MNKEQRAAMRKLAEEATPQDIDTALVIHDCDGKYIECPVCGGDGSVELEGDYCNFDSQAIGVQFYGIGKAHGAAEAYYRAANPSTILQLLDYIEALEKDAARYRWLRDTLSQSVGGGVVVNDAALGYESSEPGECVSVYWYPDTPIGFYESKADTLDAAIDAALQGEME